MNGSIITIVDGKVVTNKLHSKGDPVLDSDGEVVYKFRKGDVMLDLTGNPIPAASEGLERQVDLLLIDGNYWFATDATAASYRNELTTTIVRWLTNDLESLSKRLLENTRLYFYPKVDTGYIDVKLADGTVLSMPAGQSLRLDLVVDEIVNANTALKAQLVNISIASVSTQLEQDTVAVDEIQAKLRELYKTDVKSATLTGFGGSSNYTMLSVVDPATRLSLRKRLVAQPDDTLIVTEDLTVNFIVNVKKP